MSLIEGIDDPAELLAIAGRDFEDYPLFIEALQAEIAKVQRVADLFGWSFKRALIELDAADRAATEMFAIGNTLPRHTLH